MRQKSARRSVIGNRSPCVRIVAASIESHPGAATKDGNGTVWTGIQGQSGSSFAPPESAAVEVVAREVGIGSGTLERWRDDVLSMPARGRAVTIFG